MSAITEEAIEVALGAALKAGIDYLEGRVSGYSGELEMIEALMPVPAPCVRHYLGGHQRETVTTESISGPLAIGVLVIVASYDTDGAIRTGEYGAHRICRDVVALLQGNDLGITDLPPLDYLRKKLAKATPERTAYLLEFTTFLEIER